eukprot:TRINITY_DN25596_c0_g1_i1.p1 TRINITY_DN25596_c0_g1~~TRINITY_DN25596_c0_g1_i1.p1  ORF type:complete len:315 (-),score=40.59 TRINITY_DN25596_c0_g1_i1:42-986(-)
MPLHVRGRRRLRSCIFLRATFSVGAMVTLSRRDVGCGVAFGVSRASRDQTWDQHGQNLLEWLAAEGAMVSPDIRIIADDKLGREVIATADVEAGEILLQVTPELCIPAPPAVDNTTTTEEFRLAAAVIEALNDPEWHFYKAIMPSFEDLGRQLPVFWDESRLMSATEEFPTLRAQVLDRRRMLSLAAADLGVPESKLTQAHALVSTRAVGAGIHACAMIPGVDIANHSPHPNTDLSVAGEPGVKVGRATKTKEGFIWEHGTAGLVAARDISAGEPVRISYGGYPNQRFLFDYGFTLGPDNPHGNLEEDQHENSE